MSSIHALRARYAATVADDAFVGERSIPSRPQREQGHGWAVGGARGAVDPDNFHDHSVRCTALGIEQHDGSLVGFYVNPS